MRGEGGEVVCTSAKCDAGDKVLDREAVKGPLFEGCQH